MSRRGIRACKATGRSSDCIGKSGQRRSGNAARQQPDDQRRDRRAQQALLRVLAPQQRRQHHRARGAVADLADRVLADADSASSATGSCAARAASQASSATSTRSPPATYSAATTGPRPGSSAAKAARWTMISIMTSEDQRGGGVAGLQAARARQAAEVKLLRLPGRARQLQQTHQRRARRSSW